MTADKQTPALDYFLEYRDGPYEDMQGLSIIIPPLKKSSSLFSSLSSASKANIVGPVSNFAVPRTLLFVSKQDSLSYILPLGESFEDRVNSIKITSKQINDQNKTLQFTIQSCRSDYLALPYRGNNLQIGSINVFENDILKKQNKLEVSDAFLVFNPSCLSKEVTISKINKREGSTRLGDFSFTGIDTPLPSLKIKDLEQSLVSFKTEVGLQDFRLNNSQVEFNSKDTPPLQLVYEFNLVSSFEQAKNDMSPEYLFLLSEKEKQKLKSFDINEERMEDLLGRETKLMITHQVKKGDEITFRAGVGNYSRNPSGNKSIDFFVQWLIQDTRGNNITPPFRQKHEGIPPKQVAPPKEFKWKVPENTQAKLLKVVLQVDPNNVLKEFNENNNMISRYFSLAE